MILTKCFEVGVSCRNLYSVVVYLYVNGSGSITSVGEERANLSAVVYLLLCGFCLEGFPLPLGAWNGLGYFIVALPEPSLKLFRCNTQQLYSTQSHFVFSLDIKTKILFDLPIHRANRRVLNGTNKTLKCTFIFISSFCSIKA